jgi:transcriptional regulator with XRE-family HTH domain
MPIEPGQRLKNAREERGLEPKDLATAAGITVPHYYDLECPDDELYMTVSLAELARLCQALGVPVTSLFAASPIPQIQAHVDGFTTLAHRLNEYLSTSGLSLHEFEDKVGWVMPPFPDDPAAAWDWNVDCLRDVCRESGVDWLQVLATLPPTAGR